MSSDKYSTVVFTQDAHDMQTYDPRKRTDRPLSPLAATFNYVVLMVGTSLVATPFQFSKTTPLGGVLIELFLGLLMWFGAICIFNAASISDSTSFVDTGKKVFKKTKYPDVYAHLLISLPLLLVLIGALSGYIIIASSTFENYINMDPTVIRVILTVVVAALGSIKSFDNTKWISYPAFFMFLFIVIATLVITFEFYGYISHPNSSVQFHTFIQGLPILALGLNGHMGLPGMAAEMEKSKHHKVAWYLFVGQYVVVLINCIVGYFPAEMFGTEIASNVMTQLNETYQATHGTISSLLLAANIMLSTVVIIQAPLLIIPLKEIFLDRGKYTVRERSFMTNIIASFIISIVSGLLAILLPDLSDALNTVATVGSLIITGPTAAVLSLLTETTTYSKVRSYMITIFAVLFLICNFYVIYLTFWG